MNIIANSYYQYFVNTIIHNFIIYINENHEHTSASCSKSFALDCSSSCHGSRSASSFGPSVSASCTAWVTFDSWPFSELRPSFSLNQAIIRSFVFYIVAPFIFSRGQTCPTCSAFSHLVHATTLTHIQIKSNTIRPQFSPQQNPAIDEICKRFLVLIYVTNMLFVLSTIRGF